MNYARRQQYRRLRRAGEASVASVAAALLALAFGSFAAFPLATTLFVVALAFAFYARHWLALARLSRVGAHSEDEVARALAPLRGEGCRLAGRGDVD